MESHILTLRYIFKKKGKELPDRCVSLEDFFQNGIYFPQFVALIYDLDSIPNTTKSPKSIMAKNINNNAAFDFLTSKNNFFKNINSDFSNEKNRANIIQSIIEKEYFKSTNKDCLHKCNQFLKQNNDSISNFSEFSNIIGFLKLFAAYKNCSVVDILIQYIESFDIPVVINKDSFNTSQGILMFQALIILKQLQEISVLPQQIKATSQSTQKEELSLPTNIEPKKELSADFNLIFEVPPSEDQGSNSSETESALNIDVRTNSVSTQAIIEIKKEFLSKSDIVCDIPLPKISNISKNEVQSEKSKSENDNLDESHKKAIEDLKDLVNELKHQKDELNKSFQIQGEEKKKLNEVVVEQENKLKNMSNLIINLNKKIEGLNSNLEKLEQSNKILGETKKQEIEKLNNTNDKLNENFKKFQKSAENQKAALSIEITNLKKQITDLNKQNANIESEHKKQIIELIKKKEVSETELKKQIIDINKQKEATELQLKKQIRELESKLPEKDIAPNTPQKADESCRPISQLLQPLWKEREQPLEQNDEPKLDQPPVQPKPSQDKNSSTKPPKNYTSSTFFLSLPGLMNFL